MYLFLTAQPAEGGIQSMLLMVVAMIAIFYFMLIRPENKKKKAAEAMRNAIKTGDEITTIGGLVGKVVNVKEDTIVIETSADMVRIEMKKWSISTNDTAEKQAREDAKKAAEARAKERAEKKAAKKK